jgi:hypothetical protein
MLEENGNNHKYFCNEFYYESILACCQMHHRKIQSSEKKEIWYQIEYYAKTNILDSIDKSRGHAIA